MSPSLVLSNGSVVQPTVAIVTAVAVPAGSSGTSDAYEVAQSSASTWTIALPGDFPSRRPAVVLYDSANREIESDVEWYPLTRTVVVTFPSPTSGVAVIT